MTSPVYRHRNCLCLLVLVTVIMTFTTVNMERYLTSVHAVSQTDQSQRVLRTIQPITARVTPNVTADVSDVAASCPAGFQHDERSHHSFEHFRYIEQHSYYDPQMPGAPNHTERVLLLTPISNSGGKLDHYFRNLCSLSYPHRLISVALGEDSSTDRSYEVARAYAAQLGVHFADVTVRHLSETLNLRPRGTRHDRDFQYARRQHLALARNELLAAALRPEHAWVLWIDSDVKHVPRDIIQHLLSARQDVVVPACMYLLADGTPQLYDRNSWRETEESRQFLAAKPKDFLMLEGYSNSARRYITELAEEGVTVPLDGVGGCVLLVRAECHRKGLIFPPYVLDNHIETEGLAKMALRMGYEPYGLPLVKVIHF